VTFAAAPAATEPAPIRMKLRRVKGCIRVPSRRRCQETNLFGSG
jgi:hypothetical protein